MSRKSGYTRRTVLKLTAGTVAATAAGTATTGGALAAETATGTTTSDWVAVESPTGNGLYDVEYTANGAYAVGGGGVVLERTGTGWRKVLDGGPTGNGNSLYGSDVTDDGKRLWFVGSSGAIGEYDAETGTLQDHSAPMDVTNNFNDVAMTGAAGEANVYVAGDSGKIYYSFENGEEGTWDYVTPGSGSNINAIDFHADRSGHAVDGNQTVFATDDGRTWDKLGIENANHNFYGVDSDAPDDVWVSGGGGTVYHWDGAEWVRTDLGDADLRDVEVTDADDDGLTVGGGGAVFDKSGNDWHQDATPTGANLKAVARGSPDIAVGASGTILERR
jgi:hypothetical protein